MRPKLVIAGASGFIGKALMEALKGDYETIALSRSERPDEPEIEWRRCDLFSLLQAERGLKDADYALYLVHSPLPRSGLTQGSASDLDLILADNFVRAARVAGVQHIVYLGNLIPETPKLSTYLRSRMEVEAVLGAYQVPVTFLRAPIVVGARGAPFQLALELVQRLPLLLLPHWTRTLNQPMALSDIVRIIGAVIGRTEYFNQTYEIGGPQAISYQALIQAIAQQYKGRKVWGFPLPFLTPLLSRYWLAAVTSMSLQEIIPLIESLKTPSQVQEHTLQANLDMPPLPLEFAIQEALAKDGRTMKAGLRSRQKKRGFRDVRSVQRLPLLPEHDALWIARNYAQLLSRLLRPLMQTQITEDHSIRFYHLGLNKPLLELSYSEHRSSPDRALYYITGGLMARQETGVHSRLEFRIIPGQPFAIAGIHDFRPRLPWYLYLLTQANFHLWTMYFFIWYLKWKTRKSPE